jgi:predicted transcriptional regulator of viral defense system
MVSSKLKKLEQIAEHLQTLRASDLKRVGISGYYLEKLVRAGKLERIARGLYATNQLSPAEHITLLEVTHRLSKAVVCLLSALRYHEIGTQSPREVWIALPRQFHWNPKPGGGGHHPTLPYPPVRIVRFADAAMQFGVQEHRIGGTKIKVFSPAKTVADCFKFRNKIGLDVALEALRETRSQRKATMDELWEAAKVCRVTNVMKPYLEYLA